MIDSRGTTVTTPLNAPDDGEAWVKIVDHRIHVAVVKRLPWAAEARQANSYYRSDQYRFRRKHSSRDRVRMVANYIRRDIDQMVAGILDADLVVQPKGRHPRHHPVARVMLDVLSWTRDEEEDWDADFENAVQDLFHVGEGVIIETWNPSGDEGRGMPEARWVDSRFVLWDPEARKSQRDDANWVIVLEHVKLDLAKWKFDIDDLTPEGPELFMSAAQTDRFRSRWVGGGILSTASGGGEDEEKVWVKRMWEKVEVADKRYFKGGEAATFEEGGKTYPMTPRQYREVLSSKEREEINEVTITRQELWETVVVGKHFVRRKISPFCKTRKGHGHYPMAFYSGVRLRDESHCRGEIGFLIGISDVRNETISLMLDQAYLANVGYLAVFGGSLQPEGREQIEMLGQDPFQVVDVLQGTEPPRWQGYNPTGNQVFQNIIPMLDVIQNRESGIHEPDRGQVPKMVESGRAIRALQARGQLLGVTIKNHVQSGLRRQTMLRLHNISQFMEGNRIAAKIDPDTKEESNLFIGRSLDDIVTEHQLTEVPDPTSPGDRMYVDQQGQKAYLVVLNEDMARDGMFNRVRLTLDTDKQLNSLEEHEEARELMRALGPGAAPWYIKQRGLSGSDSLLEDLTNYNSGMQMQKWLEERSAKMGIPAPELLQLMDRFLSGQGQKRKAIPATGMAVAEASM